MRKIYSSATLLLMLVMLAMHSSCSQKQETEGEQMTEIRVGVFNGNGGAQTCIWEAYAACTLDRDMRVRYITTSDIAAGVLDSLDVIVVPGGGGTQ